MFNSYNVIDYPIRIGDEILYRKVRDISTNVRIQEELVKCLSVYDYKILQNGQTPEMVSFHQYNNTKLHYLVILANELYDWREAYPLTDLEFNSYVEEKYVNPENIHHYEDVNGYWRQCGDGEFTIPITFREYEYGLNEAKRHIKLIKTEYGQAVVETLKNLIGG